MSNENKNEAVQEAAEAWWADFQRKGEREMID